MLVRTISGLIGIVILFIVLSQFHTWVFNAVLFALYCIAVFEIQNAFKEDNVKQTSWVLIAAGFAALILPLNYELNGNSINIMVFAAGFVAAFAAVVVFNFEKIKFTSVASEIAFGLYVLLGFYSILRFKMLLPYTPFGWDGAFLAICAAVMAWGGDVCAYFSGFLFGKHKLAPKLSPKKTVEGAIGGVIGVVALTWLVMWVYSMIKPILEHTSQTYAFDAQHMIFMGIIAAMGAVVGMIGDLFASAVKRHVGIKDYGNIMPGHGGVLDRFDSVILVAPLVSSVIDFIIASGGVFGV